MRSPSRPPEPNQLLTFVMLALLSVVLWGIAVYTWWQAYIWFRWVTEPTFLFTFFVIPIPFLAYRSFTGQTGLPSGIIRPANPPGTSGSPTAPAAPIVGPAPSSSNPPPQVVRARVIQYDDWLVWLGNGERPRGTIILLILIFWTILYWSLPGVELSALTFSTWGLITAFSVILLRALFRPGKEVSAVGDTKSQPK
jgi:hypothetical protein